MKKFCHPVAISCNNTFTTGADGNLILTRSAGLSMTPAFKKWPEVGNCIRIQNKAGSQEANVNAYILLTQLKFFLKKNPHM